MPTAEPAIPVAFKSHSSFVKRATSMRCALTAILALASLLVVGPSFGQETVKTFTFKKTKQADLAIHVHFPPDWKKEDKRPAIVFFFGGGFQFGDASQFVPQATYFASRGMVAARADYRVKSRHGVEPDACVEDAKSAVRWLRQNAAKLGMDSNRLVACGSSSGGYLAACTACPGLEPEGEDLKISSRANAMILVNPFLPFVKEKANWKIVPALHLTKDTPPTLILFGTKDELLPRGEEFMAKAKEVGHTAEMFLAEGVGHGFAGKSPWREKVDQREDEFLVALGYLQGKPTIKVPEGKDQKPQPKDAPPGAKLIRDLEYAKVGDVKLSLDLYLPTEGAGPLPVIVAIQGGGWAAGRKEEAQGIRQASRGYAVAAISYRLSGVVTFPAQIEDCKAAVRWLRANAKKYNLDADRVGATGHSAGGHLASLLGTAGSAKEFDKGDNLELSSRVIAVCALSGPTDFVQMDAHALKDAKLKHDFPGSPESRLIGGPIQNNKEKVARANPITYVSKDSPPFLLIHGDQDPLVPVHQAHLLHDALKEKGVPVQLHIVKGAGHGVGGRDVNELIDRFFDANLKNPGQKKAAQDPENAHQEKKLPEGLKVGEEMPVHVVDFFSGARRDGAGCPSIMISNAKAQGVEIWSRTDDDQPFQLACALEAKLGDGKKKQGYLILFKDSLKKAIAAKPDALKKFHVAVPKIIGTGLFNEADPSGKAGSMVFLLNRKEITAVWTFAPGELTKERIEAIVKKFAAEKDGNWEQRPHNIYR
jgi:acetyl esterase/lipase